MKTMTALISTTRRGNTDALTKTEWNTQAKYTQGLIGEVETHEHNDTTGEL